MIEVKNSFVCQLLKGLKPKQSPGYDGISAFLLSKCADIICDPLCDIYRASIESRTFPDLWKNAYIRPIPKKPNASPHEYRQISLLPIVSKVFERIVLASMKSSFIKRFGKDQHAFRPNGSTTSCLIDIHDIVTNFMEDEQNLSVKITCLDFSKAFDKIQHNRLLNVLIERDFNKGFVLWLSSFLANRCQRIAINNNIGPPITVVSGVPQGSVLGPYLFAIFIGTLNIESSTAKLVKYADDLTLIESCLRVNPNPTNLDAILRWNDANKMCLNQSKCYQMLIHRIKNASVAPYDNIQLSTDVNILGVTLNDRLKWDDHFDHVLLSATRRLFILRCVKPFVTKMQLLEVFKASILSILTYASPLFCNISSSIRTKLQRLIKRAHRIICDPTCSCPIIPDLDSFRHRLAMNFLKKCDLPSHPLHDRVPPRMSYSGHYRLNICSTTRRLNSFFPSTCMLANDDSSSMTDFT